MRRNVIRVAKTVQIEQIDDFPSNIERSFEGSMHIRPGGVYQVSDAELEHLQSVHPELIERVIQRSKNEERSVAKSHREEKRASRDKKVADEKKAAVEASLARDAELRASENSDSSSRRGINLVDETEEPSE